MFSVGDKILYPMHGAGIIKEIEDQEVLGEMHSYYVLELVHGSMKVMIPVANCSSIGVREIISCDTVSDVMDALSEKTSDMDNNWNRRYRENSLKLKTGNIFDVAEVVRNLTRIENTKKLSSGEKKMLVNARQILVSEICLTTGKSFKEIENLVDKAI